MWISRVPCAGGYLYRLYVNDADRRVLPQGVNYLWNIGWHPETNTFASAGDDRILWLCGLIM